MKKKIQKVLVIVGPTATGKSALAVEIARKFDGEIISADSRQVYRGLDVGTGKIIKKEMRGIPHHLLDVASPKKQFSVAEYQTLAQNKIADILARGKLPIICGGTGLYVDAALGRAVFPEVPPNPALRAKLEQKSPEALFAMLQEIAPERARTIDRHNPRRLVRALEIASAGSNNNISIRPYDNVLWLGLTLPLDILKRKIHTRLLTRINKQDMISETRRLHAKGLSWKRMEALGLEYRYLSRYLRGRITKEEMTAKLQTEIYRYARRQMTWFKRNKEIRWFAPSQKKEIFATIKNALGD